MDQLDLFNQPPVLNRYHNTNDLEGVDLKKREIRTGTQNADVLNLFRLNEHIDNLTAWEIYEFRFMKKWPITSIRRAMTDLTKLGYLEKTSEKRPGQYGDLTYAWKLKQ